MNKCLVNTLFCDQLIHCTFLYLQDGLHKLRWLLRYWNGLDVEKELVKTTICGAAFSLRFVGM